MSDTPRVHLDVLARDGHARSGRLTIRGRRVRTPAFMPVGTAGSVKGLSAADLRRLDVEMLLANTLHLRLRPGPERVAELGGLHRMMGFDGAILTDSGGYQIFSLASRVKLDEDGATFHSHLDGERVRLTPEEAIRIQDLLDPDVAMVLDQPVALPATAADVELAAARTLRWAERCLRHHREHVTSGQALFGIVQGALDLDARARQVDALVALGFDGYALGGLAVGESKDEMRRVFASALPALPADRVRYVMGIGHPEDLLAAIEQGSDLFDCVLPTRHARTGQAFTSRGVVRLRNQRHRASSAPLDPACPCETCTTYALGYLAHLYHSGEMLGPILVARHNVHFYQSLVHGAGEAIAAGRFAAYRDDFLAAYFATVEERELAPPRPSEEPR
jgi:queuine tRNA-ribosyltransferase